MHVETAVSDWLLTDGAAKVLRMPVSTHGGEVTAVNWLRTLFAEMRYGHGL